MAKFKKFDPRTKKIDRDKTFKKENKKPRELREINNDDYNDYDYDETTRDMAKRFYY